MVRSRSINGRYVPSSRRWTQLEAVPPISYHVSAASQFLIRCLAPAADSNDLSFLLPFLPLVRLVLGPSPPLPPSARPSNSLLILIPLTNEIQKSPSCIYVFNLLNYLDPAGYASAKSSSLAGDLNSAKRSRAQGSAPCLIHCLKIGTFPLTDMEAHWKVEFRMYR